MMTRPYKPRDSARSALLDCSCAVRDRRSGPILSYLSIYLSISISTSRVPVYKQYSWSLLALTSRRISQLGLMIHLRDFMQKLQANTHFCIVIREYCFVKTTRTLIRASARSLGGWPCSFEA